MKILAIAAATLLLGACASFDGRGLVPGQSRAADVEASMGSPHQRLALPNGDTALYYSRLPEGRKMFVATLAPDGTLRGIEQRLEYPFIKRIVPNTTTAAQVRELLGPPWTSTRMARQQRVVWEYPWRNVEDRRMLWVQFSDDEVVREVIELHDYESDPPSGADAGAMP
jgi:hypothetical protein